MKSVIKFSVLPLLAAASLFCGCSKGEAGDGGKAAPAEKSYDPLVGTNAFAVVVADYGKMQGNPLLCAFNDLCERKAKEFGEAFKDAADEKVPEALAKYGKMTKDEAIRHFYGIEPTDFKWGMGVLEKFDPAALVSGCPTNVVAPPAYGVICAARPLDLDHVVKAYRELFEAVRASNAEMSNACAQASAQYGKCLACERTEIDGAPAYRLTVTDPESGEKIGGASPLATTICGGKLLVVALSDAMLAHVKGLFDGSEPAAPAESAIGRELSLPNDVLFRMAVRGIDEFASALACAKNGKGKDNHGGINPNDFRSGRLDVGFDTSKTNLFLRVATELDDPTEAATFAKEAQEGITGAMGLLQLLLGMKPEFAFVGPILQTLEVRSSGNTLAAGIAISYAVLEGIDCRKLAESVAEAKKNAPALPFPLPGAGDDDDDENVIK